MKSQHLLQRLGLAVVGLAAVFGRGNAQPSSEPQPVLRTVTAPGGGGSGTASSAPAPRNGNAQSNGSTASSTAATPVLRTVTAPGGSSQPGASGTPASGTMVLHTVNASNGIANTELQDNGPAGGSAVTGVSPYNQITLPNGLQVIVIEDHSLPLTTIDLTVRNGSFTEPDEFAGLSHLYEHMFYKANQALPSQEAFMSRVRELGMSFNGYTSDEVVTYFFTLPSSNLNPGMKFMSDAAKTPLFLTEELVKEREVVLGEFDRNEASPEFTLRYALDSAMWMPYVARKQPLGQRPVIKSATTEKMHMIQNRFYVPNNSALIISGDVKPEEVFSLAKQYFSDWQRGSDPFPTYNPPAFPALQSKLVVREAKIPDVVVRMMMRGPSLVKDDPEAAVAELVGTMLDQPTSRLNHVLVDSGLATTYGVGYDDSRNVGSIQFYMRTSPEKARAAIDKLKSEIAAMKYPGYFTADDIATAKQIISDQRMFERDNLYNFTIQTTARWWSQASLDYYLNFPTAVRNVTAGQISDFIQKYIIGQPVVLGVGAQQAALNKLNLTPEVLKW